MLTIRRIAINATPLLVALFATTAQTAFSQPEYTYRRIDFPGAGFPGTVPTGINDAGHIVGYYYGAHAYYHGFTLVDGVFSAMGFPDPEIQSSLNGINNCDSMVGHVAYFGNPNIGYRSFVVTNGNFSPLNYAGSAYTLASGINDHGDISGTYDLTSYTGFVFSHGQFTTPVNLPPYPSAINDLGDEVGYYCPGNPTCVGQGTSTGFLYNQRTQTVFPITFPGAHAGTLATGINNAGEIVGIYYPYPKSNPQGFLYSNGVFTPIAMPGGFGTLPNAINNAGVIVGSFGDGTGASHGFIATPNSHPAAPPPSGCNP